MAAWRPLAARVCSQRHLGVKMRNVSSGELKTHERHVLPSGTDDLEHFRLVWRRASALRFRSPEGLRPYSHIETALGAEHRQR
jgi:hypothetical protein